MKNLCVYCGSNTGSKPIYQEQAIALGTRLAKDGIGLVYGGGNIGNLGGRHSDPIPWHAWPQSLSLTLPPLAIVILKLERQPADVPLLPASAASGSASAGTGSAS